MQVHKKGCLVKTQQVFASFFCKASSSSGCLYFTTSNQFSVEKQATPSIFLILSEVRHNTEVKTVANFQFTRTLKLNRNIKTTEILK